MIDLEQKAARDVLDRRLPDAPPDLRTELAIEITDALREFAWSQGTHCCCDEECDA